MDFSEALRTERLVAIIRGRDAEASFRTVMALAEAGLPLIEVSLSGKDALKVIRRARAELGDAAWLGAGTVLTGDDARRAAEAGANLIVTPGLGAGLEESVRQGLPTLAGVMTPSEVIAAEALGVSALKLFPASAGGPGYLEALRGPFPELPFVPVGGVDAGLAQAYFEAGAVAVGVGSPLVGDAADGGDLDGLRKRAAEFRAVCAR
ncbi:MULTISPECIES: bifunctional 4-hydroxy-2-oxoglutarate aldolase/2-dehydro-3-deoxy-phosphogluconate aldolase [Streptomyces]|uniref:bifunctional 4-hydroxy-2-oxoglutarate aldolase/2-dehydro-3-deoxy-phosphogluconate aldolase n=1 Tax=Streptomyces TaxID=1883 RepID=UPI0005246B27|nr:MULTISPECIES: bifunctional 4-hydroxy-2-oxoglutarate aldolase/2-dehydro-3-deoxy-phosphogluconate aldolase [Streptomyces]ARH91028.1 aldolase [Streptomyces sp. MOE7]MDC7339200.1 bifunctional 4-hydroxy-2-oxoglutarate aldolase/2-dehydro-3-deoxy-phosphogluconate aldolase [Streptomyces lydicus]UEG91286.1 bifunctional 4-hydroxy-2-oxoglutarate aldolase/2-dehydro-3-deoxy-phosphogluconate aldolase [Streptomyces lydicus]